MIHNCIVLSYNRPRMVREAVMSVLNSRNVDVRCWVYDDGSDFDIGENLSDIDDDRLFIFGSDPISPDERIRRWNTRWATNMNWVMSKIPNNQTITFLCDDDLLHEDWLSHAEHFLTINKNLHVVIGDMYYFYDGEEPYSKGRKGFPAGVEIEGEYVIWWNLGSFTHRSECFHECGIRWRYGYKGYPHSWDLQYINDLLAAHVGYVKVPIPAMFRREHDNTISARAGRIENGVYVRAAEQLLPEHVQGMME